MDVAEKERLIAKISWGYIPVTVITNDGTLTSLLLRSPTPKEQAQSAIVYSTERQRATIIGLPPETEILERLVVFGQWSPEKDAEIEGLQKDIHTIRRGLLDFLFNKTKLEKTRSLLRRAENALIERLNKKHVLLQNSAEAQAEICQQRYLIGRITETEDGESFWPTIKDFDDYNDDTLVTQLCEAFFQKSRVPIVLIRKLARSQQWRAYWETAKNTNDLFDGPVSSWSLNQRELAHWSTIYDSVYNAYDRPSKDIIDDDDLLDSWFIRQGEKIEKRTQVSVIPKSNKSGRNEEFIMSDREGAKHVYNMNDPGTRVRIKARQKLLSQQGTMREQDMPDSQREMRQQVVEMQRKHIKNINSK
jgi:hypothetical protein